MAFDLDLVSTAAQMSLRAYCDPVQNIDAIYVSSCENAQAFIWMLPDTVTCTVAFRGTSAVQDALTAIDVRMHGGKVHKGFNTQFHSIEADISKHLQGLTFDRLVFCGHSLGGALATLAALHYSGRYATRIECVTFGSPCVGNRQFALSFNEHVKCWRVYNENDPVASAFLCGYTHVCNGIALDADGNHRIIRKPRAKWFFPCMPCCKRLKDIDLPDFHEHSIHVYIERLKNIHFM